MTSLYHPWLMFACKTKCEWWCYLEKNKKKKLFHHWYHVCVCVYISISSLKILVFEIPSNVFALDKCLNHFLLVDSFFFFLEFDSLQCLCFWKVLVSFLAPACLAVRVRTPELDLHVFFFWLLIFSFTIARVPRVNGLTWWRRRGLFMSRSLARCIRNPLVIRQPR